MMELNALPPEEAQAGFLSCCGSRRWARAMTGQRPFGSYEAMAEQAAAIWRGLDREDWLEAFAAHPRIGDRAAIAGAGSEQAGVRDAPHDTLEELERLNSEYQARFGYIFIVCASGKSAGEMLSLLRARLLHDPREELLVACEQQLAITLLRLKKNFN